MPDAASILRVAEQERDHASEALANHLRDCTAAPRECAQRDALEAHLARAQRQVELLTPGPAEDEALW